MTPATAVPPRAAVLPLSPDEEAELRETAERWNPRCAFTYLGDARAGSALYECGTVRSGHVDEIDGHAFVERPSDRLTIRRLLATLDRERQEGAPR